MSERKRIYLCLAHHKHVQKMYEELLADVPGVHVHSQPKGTCSLGTGPMLESSTSAAGPGPNEHEYLKSHLAVL